MDGWWTICVQNTENIPGISSPIVLSQQAKDDKSSSQVEQLKKLFFVWKKAKI